jgi:hypothetical protein
MDRVQFTVRRAWKTEAILTYRRNDCAFHLLQPSYFQTRHYKCIILLKTLLFLACITIAFSEELLVSSFARS